MNIRLIYGYSTSSYYINFELAFVDKNSLHRTWYSLYVGLSLHTQTDLSKSMGGIASLSATWRVFSVTLGQWWSRSYIISLLLTVLSVSLYVLLSYTIETITRVKSKKTEKSQQPSKSMRSCGSPRDPEAAT